MLSSRVSLRTSRVAAVAPRARVAQRSAPRVSAVATPAPAGEPSNNNSNKLSIVQSSRKASSIVTKTSSGDAAASEPEFLGIAKSTMMKVVPLTLMMFCILFNYTILRDTKDVLVVTAPGSGAEIIPFFEDLAQPPVGLWFHVAVLQALERHGTSEAVLHHHLPVPCVLHVVRLRDLPAQGLHPPLRRHERRAQRGGG